MKNRYFKAFTLVELAVVLLVIGILAGILIRNYGGFTSAARDARILADLRNVSTMLAAYYSKAGNFPDVTMAANSASWTDQFADTLINMGVITNRNELPRHPLSGKFYQYFACDRDGASTTYSTGSAYILAADLEAPTSNVQIYSGSVSENAAVSCVNTDGSSFSQPSEIRCYPSGQRYCLYNY